MDYLKRLEKVSVLGAGGKMGSGILLLTAIEMHDQKLLNPDKEFSPVIYAIDLSSDALSGLYTYLGIQIRKIAEKKTVWLREMYCKHEELVENSEIIQQYITDVLAIVRPVTRLEAARDSMLIFEAVNENKDLKVKIFNDIDSNNKNNAWFFTNTSSVPIHSIDEAAKLKGRILGFHFYNPPAVQKLLELIPSKNTAKELIEFAEFFAKRLKKIIVHANDIAGFIGNGHFMRDALYGIHQAEALAKDMPLYEAVYTIDTMTRDWLLRPMGIFQLIDYVGIDVVRFIMQVMNPYMPDEDLHSSLLDDLFAKGIKGGQYSSGAQKPGFFQYTKAGIIEVVNPENGEYLAIEKIEGACKKYLGVHPEPSLSWKKVMKLRQQKEKALEDYFNILKESNNKGAKLAVDYGKNSCKTGKKLVEMKVAHSAKDVNTVLLTGFFHAYGPVNNYFNC